MTPKRTILPKIAKNSHFYPSPARQGLFLTGFGREIIYALPRNDGKWGILGSKIGKSPIIPRQEAVFRGIKRVIFSPF